MTFEVGRLSAALTLDGVDKFHRDLDQAGRKLQDTGGKGAAFGSAVASGVRTAAGATTGLVPAAGAYLTILTRTGVAYNSLQQNSRAALSVMLGDAEKANAQMDKLDAFARNSPFAKDVFVQAQQQLLGFGVEASKVIPYLDAIQNAVAATGGSSARVGELSTIMAQIRSSAKITAMDLREFGNRGVDAAQIIGDEMGKTAAEIRDDITNSALDAQVALDALAAGMQKKFGGTTDLVKQQWTGATDRIKAANRDLGAAIAEPFVSQRGGGMAVTWGNQVADVLRAIEKQAVPVMSILTQRGMPFFATFTQQLDSAQQSIQRWNPANLERSLDAMSDHAPGIAALAGATLALGANVGPLGQVFRVLGISANPVLAAFVGLAAASPEVRAALGDLLAAGKPLLPLLGELAVIMSGTLNSALPLAAGGVQLLTAVLRPVVSLIDAIPAPVLAGAAAFIAMHAASKSLAGPLGNVVTILQQFGQRAAVQAALGQTTVGMGALSAASMTAQSSVRGLGTALKTAFLSNPIGIALTVVAAAVGAWAMANAAAQQKVEEHQSRVRALKDTLDETTGALTEASNAQVEANLADTKAAELAGKIGVSYRDVKQAVLGNEAAYARVTAAVDKYSDSMTTGDKNADTWNSTFMEGQANVRDFNTVLEEHRASVDAAQEAKREMIQADRDAAAAMTDAARSNQRFNEAIEVARDITKDAETRVRALKQALDELKGGAISAEEAQKRLSETNLSLAEGLAQTDEAGARLWASTLDGAGKIDVGSRAGLAFADTMARSRDAMLDAAMAASDQALANGDLAGAVEAARSAGNGYLDTLRSTMAEAELTQAQIDGLIGTYLDVPSVVATMLTTNGTFDEATQQLFALALQLGELPEGESITIDEPESPEILKRLEALGYKITHLPDGNVKITSTGASSVEATLNYLTRYRETTIGVRYVGGGDSYGSGQMTRANGGLDVHYGDQLIQAFANGGFPTGLYRGGPPVYKFAEPETGWEAFISGRKGQEARNAKIAMEALRRLGVPVVPLSAVAGARAFNNGGLTGGTQSTVVAELAPSQVWTINQYYPMHSDPTRDALEEAAQLNAASKGGF